MKRLMILAMFMLILTGCATTQLTSTSTEAQKKAALCQDAQMGMAIADAVVQTQTLTEQESKYWTAYKVSAETAIKLYCM